MPPGIGYGKKVKVDPKSKLGKNIKKDRVKIKQTTQDRLDEAEGKKKGKKTNTQTKQDRLDEAEGKKKGKMKFKVVKVMKGEKAPPTFEKFWLDWVNAGNDEDYYNEGRPRGTERAAARRDAKKEWKKKYGK